MLILQARKWRLKEAKQLNAAPKAVRPIEPGINFGRVVPESIFQAFWI